MNKEGPANDNMFDEIEKFPELRRDQVDGVFIDFSEDGALQKLIYLSKCPFNERLTYTKHLADLLQLIGEKANDHLKQIIDFIIADNDDIKRTLLIQLPYVIEHLKIQSYGYAQIRDILTPALFQLIGNENLDIKEDSGKILAQIGDIMNEEDRGKYILTKVLNMAHDDQVDDNRIVAIQLLTQMAHCFGADLCEQFVSFEILSLGEDPQLRVRKESVLNLPIIGKVVSQDFFQQRLLPFYIKKSQDNFWGIRKACIEIIVEISNVCSNKVKENELTELLLNCLKDQSKWVKISAYKNLGPFIVTLEKCHASEKLFDHYTKMTDSTINTLSNENEILIACAQYFPAVLKVYGEKKWNQLQKTFMFLLKSNNKKVKKPIACSLHEIALILGQEKAEKDLFNVLDQILKDPNDEVKYGAISNLAQFMQVFDSQKRENFLDVFLILQKDPKKWRIRELIARQIEKLALMFNSETVFRYIMPISFKLCNDTVAIVREEAAKKVHSILLQLQSEAESSEIFLGCVVDNIRAFSISNRFNQRQTFVLMCNQLMMYPDIFKKHFIDIFETLATDKVVNVRISLASTISQHIKQKGPLRDDPIIKKIVGIMSQDKSRDVRSHFGPVEDFVQSKEVQLGRNQKGGSENKASNSSQIAPKRVESDDELDDGENSKQSPKKGTTSPKKESKSPVNQANSPKKENKSPINQASSPKKEAISPKIVEQSPKNQDNSPKKDAASPNHTVNQTQKDEKSPINKAISPKRVENSPKQVNEDTTENKDTIVETEQNKNNSEMKKEEEQKEEKLPTEENGQNQTVEESLQDVSLTEDKSREEDAQLLSERNDEEKEKTEN